MVLSNNQKGSFLENCLLRETKDELSTHYYQYDPDFISTCFYTTRLPSQELTYPLPIHFWRWFSFAQVGYIRSPWFTWFSHPNWKGYTIIFQFHSLIFGELFVAFKNQRPQNGGTHLCKLYGYGLWKRKPIPKIALFQVQVQETLYFRYLKFLVIIYHNTWIRNGLLMIAKLHLWHCYWDHLNLHLKLLVKRPTLNGGKVGDISSDLAVHLLIAAERFLLDRLKVRWVYRSTLFRVLEVLFWKGTGVIKLPIFWLALSREWGNQPLHWYIGDSFPHSLLRAS